MDFFGIGPWEILLILILALILVGPGKITEIARNLGRTIRAVKKASSDLTASFTKELETTRIQPPASQDKTGEAASAINKSIVPSQNDQPTKPGEASATK